MVNTHNQITLTYLYCIGHRQEWKDQPKFSKGMMILHRIVLSSTWDWSFPLSVDLRHQKVSPCPSWRRACRSSCRGCTRWSRRRASIRRSAQRYRCRLVLGCSAKIGGNITVHTTCHQDLPYTQTTLAPPAALMNFLHSFPICKHSSLMRRKWWCYMSAQQGRASLPGGGHDYRNGAIALF